MRKIVSQRKLLCRRMHEHVLFKLSSSESFFTYALSEYFHFILKETAYEKFCPPIIKKGKKLTFVFGNFFLGQLKMF